MPSCHSGLLRMSAIKRTVSACSASLSGRPTTSGTRALQVRVASGPWTTIASTLVNKMGVLRPHVDEQGAWGVGDHGFS